MVVLRSQLRLLRSHSLLGGGYLPLTDEAVSLGAPDGLGGYPTQVEPRDYVWNDLLAPVTAAERTAGFTIYNCGFVYNASADPWTAGVIWLSSATPATGVTAALAIDALGPLAATDAGPLAAVIAAKATAPTGVGAFSSPTTQAAGLALGTIPAGYVKAFWVRRTAAAAAAAQSSTTAGSNVTFNLGGTP